MEKSVASVAGQVMTSSSVAKIATEKNMMSPRKKLSAAQKSGVSDRDSPGENQQLGILSYSGCFRSRRRPVP